MHDFNKFVVSVLLVCAVASTTLSLLASIWCYLRWKDRQYMHRPACSSKDTSWNSASNLISHRSTSLQQCQINVRVHLPLAGCLPRLSSLFGNRKRALPGTVIQFAYSELENATNNFSNDNLIGLGGSSSVFRGQLKDGRVVAIKRFKVCTAESEFLTEFELSSRFNHCHIMMVVGCCSEFRGRHLERLLVFQYMSNGNLRDCLDGQQGGPRLDWARRVGIALGVARGLEYLHEAAAPRILHRDIKSTNILLDEKWNARITDLGMAKRFVGDDAQSCSSSPERMLGTFGYFAPECVIVGKASLKSDVFSFGVVLLELISGRPPVNKSSSASRESLIVWAVPRLLDRKRVVSEVADPLLKGKFCLEEMQVMSYLASECLQLDPELRPSMSEIVHVLSTIAPDRSWRRSALVNLVQMVHMPPALDSVIDAELDGSEQKQPCGIFSREQLAAAGFDASRRQCSVSLRRDRSVCTQGKHESETILSVDYMERLLYSTCEERRRRGEEEVVDLTEPRLESF